MKTEINRLQALRIRWATAQFRVKNSKEPATSADLVKAGLLEKPPIDYKTGKEMTLEQAALH
jgi:hypothetical protein